MTETTKKWEFRKLDATDVFPVLNLVKKIGFKEFKEAFKSDELKTIAQSAKGGDDSATMAAGAAVVFDIVGVIIDHIGDCQDDIFDLLASFSNLEREEVEKLSMAELAEMIIELVQKDDFADFFKVVSKLLK